MRILIAAAALTLAACSTTSGRSVPVVANDLALQINVTRHGGGLKAPTYLIDLIANGEKIGSARTRETASITGNYRGRVIAANCGTQSNWKGAGVAANVVGIATGDGTVAAVVCDAFADGKPAGQLVAVQDTFK